MRDRFRRGETTDDPFLLRLGGLALPAAIWLLGIVASYPGGPSQAPLGVRTALVLGLVVVDQTLPSARAPCWRRLLWLAAEILLSLLVVQAHGSVVRPALIYLLPASRALLLFGERPGLVLSLAVWLAYGVNVGLFLWPDRLGEFVSYFSFLLAPYIAAVVLTLATLRQAADRHRLQRLYDELHLAHTHLQALHQQAREAAVAEERNRLAREIHDSLAHYLTVISVQLEAAEKLGAEQVDRALEQVRRARRLTLECLQEVRRSVAALRASTLEELSWSNALEKLAAEFGDTTGLQVELRISAPEDIRLAPEIALALYRIAQEGLTNVHRHAHATRVLLAVTVSNGAVELVVQDDGHGPPAEPPSGQGGFGLLGLRERVELLGGRLGFGRAPSGGSRLEVVLPVQVAHDAVPV